MKTLKRMAVIVTMLAATLVSAEQKNLVTGPKANVPFRFQVGNHVLPAGQYEVRIDGKVLRLIGNDGEGTLALTHYMSSVEPAESSKLEFVSVDGTYQLYRVLHAGQNEGEELALINKNSKIAQSDTVRISMGK